MRSCIEERVLPGGAIDTCRGEDKGRWGLHMIMWRVQISNTVWNWLWPMCEE